MSCFRTEKKRSVTYKVWKGFISTLQRRLKGLETIKFRSNKTSQYRLQHHHHYHLYDCHFKHLYHEQQEDNYGIRTKHMVEPLLIESTHAMYIDMERKMNKAVFVTNVIERDHEGCRKVEEGDVANMETGEDDKSNDDNSFASCQTTKQHSVDASAEEFINKMRGSWKLEKQRSVEDYIQRWARLHEY